MQRDEREREREPEREGKRRRSTGQKELWCMGGGRVIIDIMF